ncbi:MAG: CHAD domain-containing protein [Bacteroidota bacterium]|nr:CHAD domain-containing protein [Bacteroidota bacterium]
MAKRKRWEIPELQKIGKFRPAARRILSHRLDDLLRLANDFKETGAPETLHQFRIAIRRLRYPLETLISQFPRRVMLRFLEELNALQDAAGAARDMDVLIQKMQEGEERFAWNIRRIVFIDLAEERTECYRALDDILNLFLLSPNLYDFKNAIRFDAYIERQSEGNADSGDERSDTVTALPPDVSPSGKKGLDTTALVSLSHDEEQVQDHTPRKPDATPCVDTGDRSLEKAGNDPGLECS